MPTETATSQPAPAAATTPLRQRPFRLLWQAYMASVLGDRVNQMALLALAAAIAGEDAAGSMLVTASICFTLPMMLLSPFAGVLVDRVNRKRFMILLNVARAGLVLLFPWIGHATGAAGIYALSAALGSAAAMFTPAAMSLLPETLHRDSLQNAAAFTATTAVLALLAGIALGGWIVGHLGMNGAFAFDSLMYIAAAGSLALLPMRTPRAPGWRDGMGGAWRDFRRGLRAAWRYRSVRELIFLIAVFWFISGCVYSGILLAMDHFHWSIEQVSQLLISLGIGLIAGSLLVGAYTRVFYQKVGFPYGLSLFLLAVALLLLAKVGSFGAVLGGLFFLGAASVTLFAPAQATLQRLIPDSLRGKVFGVLNSVTILAYLGGLLLVKQGYAWWSDIQFLSLLLAAMMLVLAYLVGRRRLKATWDLYWFCTALTRPFFEFVYRLRWTPAREVPPGGALIVAANHTSYFDALLLCVTFPRQIRWMMTERFYKAWWGHWFFRRMNCICVEEKGGNKAALKAALAVLERREVLGIFPEGRLSLNGELNPGQGGVAFLARKTGAPVAVAAIEGAFHAFPKGRWLPRLTRIRMQYHPEPLRFSLNGERDEIVEIVMDAIRRQQCELRGEAFTPAVAAPSMDQPPANP